MSARPETTNALTVDVEEYFHVAALSDSIRREDWDSIPSRVERSTNRLLKIFDDASVSATFFILGWVAKRYPDLVRAISDGGHEVACHGYSHQLIYNQRASEFEQETFRAKSLLEDISGRAVNGYRAASYSITQKSTWALKTLADAGFTYDSSIVPVRHDFYGMPSAPDEPFSLEIEDGRRIMEFPPSTISLLGQKIPIGGGGYFRIFPYWFSRWGMQKVNDRAGIPFSFYLHPWEIDPEQPRVSTNAKSKFRHYTNLHKCEERLTRLLGEFNFGTMTSVLQDLTLKRVAINELVDPIIERKAEN